MLHVVMRAAWGPPARHAGGQCACGTHSTSALAKGGRWAGPVPAKPLTPTMSTVPVGDGPGCDARAGALDTRAALTGHMQVLPWHKVSDTRSLRRPFQPEVLMTCVLNTKNL